MEVRNWEQIQLDITLLENAMKQKLWENDHKGYWDKTSLLQLAKRLEEEVEELNDAILTKGAVEIVREAADVANFVMMICSNAVRNQLQGRGQLSGFMTDHFVDPNKKENTDDN